jgi:hypothetical protein
MRGSYANGFLDRRNYGVSTADIPYYCHGVPGKILTRHDGKRALMAMTGVKGTIDGNA